MEKYIGKTEDGLVWLEFNSQGGYFSLSGTVAELQGLDADSIQEIEEDSIGDYEYLWKEAVAADRTTLGMDDYLDNLLEDFVQGAMDGSWMDDNEEYHRYIEVGQIDMSIQPDDIEELAPGLSRDDLTYIYYCWRTYHLKNIDEIDPDVIISMNKIFAKLPDSP